MPWEPQDVKRHTKKADTPKKKRQWAGAANASLDRGLSEASAIRIANAAIHQAEKNVAKGKRTGQGIGSIRKPGVPGKPKGK